ncbi:expressed unknown protein [Seminavis robusta]|uniref:Uncharacterized protein n=1 Tax=Seminavis robusta TaxID=568900 RepID=A0A9N8DIQ9_9STRA|nr:expressed unknown protein [Seminavis robusta]|eukprot:Sro105_g053080.1 n/a (445) ;mRNA; f:13242-14576
MIDTTTIQGEEASVASSSTTGTASIGRRYLPHHLLYHNSVPNSPPDSTTLASQRRKDQLIVVARNMESLLEKRASTSAGTNSDEKSLSSLEKRRRLAQLQNAHDDTDADISRDPHAATIKEETTTEVALGMTITASHHHHGTRSRDSPLDTTITVKTCFGAPPSHIENAKTANEEDDDVPGLITDSCHKRQGSSLICKLLFEELQKEEPKSVARAAEKLGSIFKHGNPQECSQAVSLGGHSVLISAMKKWSQHEPIVLHCSHAIFRMIGTYTKRCGGDNDSQNDDDEEDEDRFDLIEGFLVAGALEVLVNALRNFPRSSEVQLFGMGALGNLLGAGMAAALVSDTSRQAAREFVEEHYGVSLLVTIMTRFAHKPKVQEFGCWIVARLARMRRFHGILKREALVAVSTAVQNNPKSATINKQASSFMASIFRLRPASEEQGGRQG